MSNGTSEQTATQKLGYWLIRLGVIGFAASIVLDMLPLRQEYAMGSLPAVSFFIIMLGIAFVFPELLSDESKGLSTMRVIVFMVVSVFVVIAIKIGWAATNFDDFKLDRTWVYILGLAFGSKVFQSFSEKLGEEPQQPKGPPAPGN